MRRQQQEEESELRGLETEDKTKEFELEDSDVKNHPARQSFMVSFSFIFPSHIFNR